VAAKIFEAEFDGLRSLAETDFAELIVHETFIGIKRPRFEAVPQNVRGATRCARDRNRALSTRSATGVNIVVMKRIALLGIAAAAIPGAALAQAVPPMPPDGDLPRPDRAQMRAMRGTMSAIHTQARTAMLGALSAPHRSLLAGIVGELAVSTTPDVDGAVKRLDGALSADESKAVLAAADAMHRQMRAALESMRPAGSPPGASMGGPRGTMGGGRMEGPGEPADAGRALLRMAVAFGGPPHGEEG
jgi:hypothetical protein